MAAIGASGLAVGGDEHQYVGDGSGALMLSKDVCVQLIVADEDLVMMGVVMQTALLFGLSHFLLHFLNRFGQPSTTYQMLIEVLSSIRHPNMVLLMGACPEYGCIVYEYMSNGSLEDRLFCHSNTPPLPWQLRFKIAAELATGLLFLHQTKPEPLVHRDLKPANILLDNNFVSKIADVGLARLVPSSVADAVTQYCMTAAAGTFCYIDPEYQQTGMLGIKSDIYALGIILLQIVTGAKPMGLAHNVERAIEEGRFQRLLDPKVPDWPIEETLAIAKMGLKCSKLRKKDRPDLATVVLPELHRMRDFARRTTSSQLSRSRSNRSLQGPADPLPPAGGSGFLRYGA